jgi:hypothetical protein
MTKSARAKPAKKLARPVGPDKTLVFISWSGPRSKHVAKALKKWVPLILQSTTTFMSDTDIAKGSRWRTEIAQHLEGAGFGIICLTPENLDRPWVLFEAGALAKHLSDRVCPYLWDMEKSAVPEPLAEFQKAKAEKDDTFDMLKSINAVLPVGSITESDLRITFDAMWKTLEEDLNETPKAPTKTSRAKKKDPDEMLELILDEVRTLSGRIRPNVFDVKPGTPIRINPVRSALARALASDDELEARYRASESFGNKLKYRLDEPDDMSLSSR